MGRMESSSLADSCISWVRVDGDWNATPVRPSHVYPRGSIKESGWRNRDPDSFSLCARISCASLALFLFLFRLSFAGHLPHPHLLPQLSGRQTVISGRVWGKTTMMTAQNDKNRRTDSAIRLTTKSVIASVFFQFSTLHCIVVTSPCETYAM